MAQASKRPRWNRRTIQTSFILLGCFSLFALYEYATYLADDEESSEEAIGLYDPELDAVYVPFQPTPYQPSLTLKPTSLLPDACLDDHLALGGLCYNPQQPKLDVVWTWVNGSDILLQDAKAHVENSYPADAPYRPNKSWKQARQFRDHDELRHSMRSVLENFGHPGNFHLITSDFFIPLDSNVTTDRPWRLGQIPQWLNTKQSTKDWSDGNVHLSIVHHADIFYPYSDTMFNSYAIESQFGHLDGVADNFIYLNDDFFFLNALTERTFYTSAYGLVFRMQSDLLVSPTQYPNNVKGEWRSLAASNVLLSARFGSRERPYVSHEAKSASLAIVHEMSVIWSSQVSTTATHPFRETLHGESDFSFMFMMVHFVIERWREALLWSWTVARHGGVDDYWGEAEMNAAWAQLGGTTASRKLEVKAAHRDSLDPKRVESNLRVSGLGQTDPTNYVFTSQDGYPYTNFDRKVKAWPMFGADVREEKLPTCTIDFNECFTDGAGHRYSRASEVFKNIAFRNPLCGDCVILELLKASGSTGLSAFLPSPTRTLSTLAGKMPSQNFEDIPHLPLVEHWDDGDFSLREVMGASRDTSVRSWTLQLLQRYRFVIGETPAHFAMLTTPSDTRALIRTLTQTDVVLLCINDDVAIGHDEVQVLLKLWQDERWRRPAAWEI